MMYNCFEIAKYFLEVSKKESKGMDPMKLLKLTYIAQGFYLAFFDRPLFSNEIQAWKYGPVIPELYHVIKPFGYNNVDLRVLELHTRKPISAEDKRFLDSLWDAYKNYSGIELSELTHREDTPWHKCFKTRTESCKINNSLIKEYYKLKIAS